MTVSMSHPAFDTGETAQPSTASTLLRELGMSHACAQQQKAALGTWLVLHEPRGPLRVSLLRNGYGVLVKETDYKRSNPVSYL
jgi:hypothetical protein